MAVKDEIAALEALPDGPPWELNEAQIKVDGTTMMLELLRNDRVELAVKLSPGDVQDSRSALERWWPW